MPGAIGEQRIEGLAGQPEPAAAGEMRFGHLLPDRHRHPHGRLLAPGHRLDVETAGAGEHRAGEQQQQRDLAVAQRMEVAADRDVQVVAARDREVHLGLAGEAGDDQGDLGELEGVQGAAPAGPLAEEVGQRLGLVGPVAAPGRFDAELAAQREGVHPVRCGGGDAQPEEEGGGGGVAVGAYTGADEGQVGHVRSSSFGSRARRATLVKKSESAARASAPPSKPCHNRRIRPTSS